MTMSKAKELQNKLKIIHYMVQDIKEINAIITLTNSVRLRASLLLLKKDIKDKIHANRNDISDTELRKYGLLDYANTLMDLVEGL